MIAAQKAGRATEGGLACIHKCPLLNFTETCERHVTQGSKHKEVLPNGKGYI